MNKIAFDINTFWFYAVLFHVVGSIVFSTMGILPLGSFLCLTILWGVYIHLSERSRNEKLLALFGWLVSGILLFLMPASYRSSFFMNLLMLLLVYYVCRQRNLSVRRYCALKRISFRQWAIVLFCSVTFMIIASYINAVSMLFVNNMTEASLQNAGKYLPQSMLVFAVLPAVTEEIMFRGYIYRGVSNQKTAIILSSILFALLHTNFNQMSYAFIMGLLFASLVSITDNLSMTVMVHLLFNCYNILLAAFGENMAAVWIQNLSIAGYRVLAPSFYDTMGNVSGKLFLAGSAVAAAAVLVTLLLFFELKRREEKTRTGDREGTSVWRPNKLFWAAGLICLLIAVSYEYMI